MDGITDISFVPKLTAQTVDLRTGELQRAIPAIKSLEQDPTLLPVVNYDNPLQVSSNLVRIVPALLQEGSKVAATKELLRLAQDSFVDFRMQDFAIYAGVLLERGLVDRKGLLLKVSEAVFDNLDTMKALENGLNSRNKGEIKPDSFSIGNRVFPPMSISRLRSDIPFAVAVIHENLLAGLVRGAKKGNDPLLTKIFIPELQETTPQEPIELQTAHLERSCCPGNHNH